MGAAKAVSPPMSEEERQVHMARVREATAKADAQMKPALDLYRERSWLWHQTCRLELRDLERLNGIVRRLSDEDLKRVAAFAEGLAEWSSFESESPEDDAKVHR